MEGGRLSRVGGKFLTEVKVGRGDTNELNIHIKNLKDKFLIKLKNFKFKVFLNKKRRQANNLDNDDI